MASSYEASGQKAQDEASASALNSKLSGSPSKVNQGLGALAAKAEAARAQATPVGSPTAPPAMKATPSIATPMDTTPIEPNAFTRKSN